MTDTIVETLIVEPMRWWHIPDVHRLESQLFPHDTWSIEQFWSELAQSTRTYVIARADDRIVGYAGTFCLPPDADIQTVGVDPRMQGRGVGRLMLEYLLTEVDHAGATHTMLEVRDDNTSAISLYTRLGFVPISRRPRYYTDGVDAIVMRRARPDGMAQS